MSDEKMTNEELAEREFQALKLWANEESDKLCEAAKKRGKSGILDGNFEAEHKISQEFNLRLKAIKEKYGLK